MTDKSDDVIHYGGSNFQDGGSNNHEIDPLLTSACDAKAGSFESLFQLVYRDLKNIAKHRLSNERSAHTLQATALVHEAYLRLAQGQAVDIKSRNHMLALSSRIMRNVLVDYARKRQAQFQTEDKSDQAISARFEPQTILDVNHQIDVLDLDKALKNMEQDLSRLVRVVECKFFAAMTNLEIASVLEVSERTIERDWDRARAHLIIALQEI